MSSRRAFSIRATTTVATSGLALILFAFAAAAQSSNSNYTFLIASGLLCESGDSGACPAFFFFKNEAAYEMSGAGMFDAQNKSVTAARTYTHKSANGNVLETGVWLASELVSFDSYGIAPGVLRQQGATLGPQPFGAKRLPMSFGPMPTGGLAVFLIRLMPISGASRTAVLQVNCALGKVPAERQTEGVRLSLEGNGPEFSEEVAGRVMFLSVRAEINTPVKTPQQGAGL